MEEYLLNPNDVFRLLEKKGIKPLFHANTCVNAVTFINNNTLLSMSYVEHAVSIPNAARFRCAR